VQLPSAPTKLRPYGAIQICLLLLLLLFPDFPATVLMQQFRSQCECEEAGRCRGQGALQSFCGQRGAGLLANSLAAQEKCSAVLHRSHRRPYKHTRTHARTHTHAAVRETRCTAQPDSSPPAHPTGSRVVSVQDSGAVGPGFKLQPRRCRVTVLGKLFTPIVPLFTKQRNW